MKFVAATILAIILFGLVPVSALGNTNLLQAENGVTLPPSGLEFSGITNIGQPGFPIDLQVSYGAFSTVTIVGEFRSHLSPSLGAVYGGQKLVKVLWSPMKEAQGYTVYLGYDLERNFIPSYGVSLWADYKYLLAFLNAQATVSSHEGIPQTPVTITPGINLKLGSKWQAGGEIEVKPGDWRTQTLRMGVDYAVFQKIRAKLMVQTSLNNLVPDFDSGLTYQTGITVRI